MSLMWVVNGGMSMGGVSVVEVQSSISFEIFYHFGLWVLALFVVFGIFRFL